MNRILVIGTSCSGKTTLGRKLSELSGVKFTDLDELYWLPDWQHRSDDAFRVLAEKEIKATQWIIAGNYSLLREALWTRADTIIWLDYPLVTVLYRAFKRSVRRAWFRERLFAGNVETFRQTFFSRQSIILWVIKTYASRRKTYSGLLPDAHARGVRVMRFTQPRQLDCLVRQWPLVVG